MNGGADAGSGSIFRLSDDTGIRTSLKLDPS